ncbi:beta-ketoacyl synthase [Muricauda ruestringensis]|uniref:Beta-ketoacyl synthase n=1 Tax=Flagellimonas aurea TaxID=2915619 RepID=A0ABS3GB17_9FLAO|nr:beta-ketoacyl synthase N-terminal-like domain-containing protein [Allomuricauda aurea]MBO0356036.1 beta-ketoacyl synthase [Allomuricauda aurea]
MIGVDNKIAITGWGSVSALGSSTQQIWGNYLHPVHHLKSQNFGAFSASAAPLDVNTYKEIEALKLEQVKYRELDPSVLYAIIASRYATSMAGWDSNKEFGINIGSSRGATSLFEKYYDAFRAHGAERTDTLASPTTTLGNIATWVANDLGTNGPEISHSITCSTALHAILNGVAWLQSGFTDTFLAGGSEAPLTPFTVAQMKALKVYTREDAKPNNYPVRSLDMQKTQNSMALGEGAAVFCMEKEASDRALAYIEGIGYGTETLEHNTSISEKGICFQKSMTMALEGHKLSDVDAIVMHAPGTVKGDLSEYNAIQKIFRRQRPALTSNKWKIGHTLGSSGALSMELALLMLQNQLFIKVPYSHHRAPLKLNKILVNAVGFGCNAVSVLLSRPI